MQMDTCFVSSLSLLVFMVGLSHGITIGSSIGESQACSKYDFEEKLLEKLVRLEHAMELTQNGQNGSKNRWQNTGIHQNYGNIERMELEEDIKEETFQRMLDKMTGQLQNNKIGFNTIVENFTSDSEVVFSNVMERYDNLSKEIAESVKAEITDTLENRGTSLNAQITAANNRIQSLENSTMSKFTELSDNKIGFTACSARLLSDSMIHFSGTVAVYGIDLGSAYNNGVFTAKDGGFYFVNSNILAGGQIGFGVLHNNDQVSQGYSNWNGGSGYHSASTSAFMRLAKGDTISIKSLLSPMTTDPSSCLTIMKI